MRIRFAMLGLVITAAAVILSTPLRPADTPARSATAGHAQVSIDNFTFGPAAITVPTGTSVTWTNKDDIPHTVVSDEKLFASPVLDTDQQFSYTFTKPGTYGYFCSIHPKMTAKVIVN